MNGTHLWTGRTKELRTPPCADDPVGHGRFAAAGCVGLPDWPSSERKTSGFLYPSISGVRTNLLDLMFPVFHRLLLFLQSMLKSSGIDAITLDSGHVYQKYLGRWHGASRRDGGLPNLAARRGWQRRATKSRRDPFRRGTPSKETHIWQTNAIITRSWA